MGTFLEEREDSTVPCYCKYAELSSGQRAEYTVEQILARNRVLPEVATDIEFWLPTAEQTTELEALNARRRAIKETEFYLAWRQARQQENARRKAQNEITKTRIDLETKVLQERQDDQQADGRRSGGPHQGFTR